MTLILFILILSLLVFIHELGHFVAAKKNGIRVEEFGLGLPPRILGKKVGETVYSLNLLPFGGFVKLTGEDADEADTAEGEDAGLKIIDAGAGSADVVDTADSTGDIDGSDSSEVIIEKTEEIVEIKDTKSGEMVVEKFEETLVEEIPTASGADGSEKEKDEKTKVNNTYFSPVDPKSFSVKKPWQRFLVLIAGVSMNFLLAIVLFYIFFAVTGFKTFQLPLFFDYKFKFGRVEELNTIVTEVQKGSGAEKSGIQLGEAVTAIDGVPVKNVKDVRAQLVGKQEKEVDVSLVDFKDQANPKSRTIKVVPMIDEEGNTLLGVYLTKSVTIFYDKPVEKVFAGFLHSYNVLAYSFSSLGKIIGISVETRNLEPVSQSVSGPVGIYNIIGSIIKYGGKKIWLTIMDYIALMSLSLAAINILPFPALDGGRAAFVLYEWVSGRKVNQKWEANIHKVGMFLLLAFLVAVTIKDILF